MSLNLEMLKITDSCQNLPLPLKEKEKVDNEETIFSFFALTKEPSPPPPVVSKPNKFSAFAFIIRNQTHILVTIEKGPDGQQRVGIPGGKGDPIDNFDIDACMIREVKEETGIELSSAAPFYLEISKPPSYRIRFGVYHVDESFKINELSPEYQKNGPVQSLVWMDSKELFNHPDIRPHVKDALIMIGLPSVVQLHLKPK